MVLPYILLQSLAAQHLLMKKLPNPCMMVMELSRQWKFRNIPFQEMSVPVKKKVSWFSLSSAENPCGFVHLIVGIFCSAELSCVSPNVHTEAESSSADRQVDLSARHFSCSHAVHV